MCETIEEDIFLRAGSSCFSHLDSKCWASLNSFLFDLISGFSFCSALFLFGPSLLLFPPFFPIPSICLLYWMSYCNPPAGKELPLSHTRSVVLSLFLRLLKGVFLNHSILLSLPLCISSSGRFLSAHCESSTVLSHASPFSPSSPLLLTCSLTGGSETVQIEFRELGCSLPPNCSPKMASVSNFGASYALLPRCHSNMLPHICEILIMILTPMLQLRSNSELIVLRWDCEGLFSRSRWLGFNF